MGECKYYVDLDEIRMRKRDYCDVIVWQKDPVKKAGEGFFSENVSLISTKEVPKNAALFAVDKEPAFVQFSAKGFYVGKGVYFLQEELPDFAITEFFGIKRVDENKWYIESYYEKHLDLKKYYLEVREDGARLWVKSIGKTFERALEVMKRRFFEYAPNAKWYTILYCCAIGKSGNDAIMVFDSKHAPKVRIARGFFNRIQTGINGEITYIPKYYFDGIFGGWKE